MVYLGIDTSVNSMPFSVFEDKELVDFGILKVEGKHLEDKLFSAYTNIQSLIDKYKVQVVVLEDVFYSKNFTSTKNTLQTLGALRLASYQKNAICYTVQASKWRKGVVKGRQRQSLKEQAVDYVNEMYDLNLTYDKSRTKTQDDIAEAIIMLEGLVWQRYTLENVSLFGREEDRERK
jgi:crossover junction endodeoxyribonuclease RuvC